MDVARLPALNVAANSQQSGALCYMFAQYMIIDLLVCFLVQFRKYRVLLSYGLVCIVPNSLRLVQQAMGSTPHAVYLAQVSLITDSIWGNMA